MIEEALPRTRDPWRGPWGRCKRFMVKYAGVFLVAFLGTAAAAVVPWMVGMVQVPSRVTALSAQVERMDGRLNQVVALSDSTQRAKSIEVSWKCLELPDSLFWASRLACGEAFAASRLEPSFWRKARPR